MIYDTLSDMIIDNRNCLVNDIKHLSKTDQERVLSAFDWLASTYLKDYISNGMIKEKLEERYTAEEIRDIEIGVGRNFRLLMLAEQKYFNDIEKGHKVGYSAECESGE